MMNVNWKSLLARVKAALMRRGRSEQDANDIAQEAFVRLMDYQREHKVEEPEAFLMKTALNLAIDVHRARQSHGEEVMLDEVVLIDGSPNAEESLLSRERLDRLNQCLARMSEKTRDIFLAHRLEGMTYKEIGLKYGLSISGVEGHVAKASLLVAGWMKGWYP